LKNYWGKVTVFRNFGIHILISGHKWLTCIGYASTLGPTRNFGIHVSFLKAQVADTLAKLQHLRQHGITGLGDGVPEFWNACPYLKAQMADTHWLSFNTRAKPCANTIILGSVNVVNGAEAIEPFISKYSRCSSVSRPPPIY